LDGSYCNALLLNASRSVRQKLNHVSSVQFSYVALYMRFNCAHSSYRLRCYLLTSPHKAQTTYLTS